jgi:outer membrane protein assembly factor BamB
VKRNSLALVTLSVCAAASVAAAAEEASPQRSVPPAMFRGDSAHRADYGPPGIRNLSLEWRFATGGKVRSSPVVAGELVLVGSEDGHLYAIDRTSGQERWRYHTRGAVTSTAAVAGSRAFVVGGGGSLHALELDSGRLLWTLSTGEPEIYEQRPGEPRNWDFYASSPVIAGDTIVIGGADGVVYAVDVADGTPRWKRAIGGPIRSTPAISTGSVYAGTMRGVLVALSLDDGEPRWTFDTEGNRNFPRGEVQSSPTVAGDLVVFGARDGFLYALDATTGSEQWRSDHDGSWVITSPAIADGLVFAGSSDGQFVQAVELATGVERWRVETGARVFSSPAVAGGLVYFGTWDGDLLGLAADDGSRKAVAWAESAIMSSPVLAGGTLYVGSDDSHLYAFSGAPYDPATAPKAIALPAETLRQLAGSYRDAEGDTYVVSIESDHLRIEAGDQSLALYPSSETEFFFKDLVTTVRFVRRDDGSVSRLELVLGDTVTPAERVP